jgi:HNH endonuclease
MSEQPQEPHSGLPRPYAGPYAPPDQPQECWLWTRARNNKGYGRVRIDGKMQLAHRVAWQIYKGEIPEGMFVCHKCDTPACVNPDHLFLGTNADNIKDSYDKGRSNQQGERNGNRKLKPEQVTEIRASSESCRVLARRFGIGKSQVANIKKGLKWTNR